MGRLAARTPRTLAVALLALAAVAAAAGCGEEEPTVAPAVLVPAPPGVTEPATDADRAGGAEDARPPAERPVGARVGGPDSTGPARHGVRTTPGHLTVHVTRTVRVRARPGGPVVAHVTPRTEFDSPTVLPVVRERDGWLGVVTSALPNGRVGWISANAALVPYRTRYAVTASLGRREVVVRRDGRAVLRFPVAIGGPSTPTPTGRFAITDKLLTNDPSSPYGCCILALSARQPHTPQGWGGGDRVAIHATNLPETIGTAASLGCLRAPAEAVRRAVRMVPLGTIVRVRT